MPVPSAQLMFGQSMQSVEAAVLLPEKGDFSQLGVKKQGLHFLTAGSKGECFDVLLLDLEAEKGLLFLGCAL